ncbi:phage tail protein [Paenibacillus sp. GbtcB18]|uniref:phage tail-collar fiber domain-containing protein n=1 Tax=Paenibacillus sp. GbtcB18 TaxID=2824763 RepID=UPI001C2F7024|nr:phage tail protein [Paenibacillus sp. GbtcB18]
MGAFGGFVLTNKGRNLQAKAETGVRLNYTRMAIGDGQLAGQSIPTLNKLISEKKSLPITKLRIQTQGRAVIGAVLSNQDITTGFYFREIGVFAQDPDEGEILFCYGNSGTNAEYIPPTGGADLVEKSIDAIVIVGTATNVTATIDSSLVYATQDDVRDAEGRAKKYTDDKVASLVIKMTGAEILTELVKVDGAGSGLDADKLQGKDPSAFLEKNTGGTVKGPINIDTSNQTGRQLAINMWGDLSASSGGQTLWGNNCYVDQGGKYRYSNTHQNVGATGLRLNFGNIEYFDTGRIATNAGVEFTPTWKVLMPPSGSGGRSEFPKAKFTGDGDALSLIGAGHVFQAFYPEGEAKGRKGYIGYPGAGQHSLHIVNEYTDGGINLITQPGVQAKWNGDELLTRKTTVISGTDLNNIKQTGFYDGVGCPNAPGTGWYYYEVITHSLDPYWVKQIAHDFYTDKVFLRRGQSSAGSTTWYPWVEVGGNGMEQYKPIVKRQSISLNGNQAINAINLSGKCYLSKIAVLANSNTVRLRVLVDGAVYLDTTVIAGAVGGILQNSDIGFDGGYVKTYAPDSGPQARSIGGTGSGNWWARPNDFPSPGVLGSTYYAVLPQPVYAKSTLVVEVTCLSVATSVDVDFAGGVPA